MFSGWEEVENLEDEEDEEEDEGAAAAAGWIASIFTSIITTHEQLRWVLQTWILGKSFEEDGGVVAGTEIPSWQNSPLHRAEQRAEKLCKYLGGGNASVGNMRSLPVWACELYFNSRTSKSGSGKRPEPLKRGGGPLQILEFEAGVLLSYHAWSWRAWSIRPKMYSSYIIWSSRFLREVNHW